MQPGCRLKGGLLLLIIHGLSCPRPLVTSPPQAGIDGQLVRKTVLTQEAENALEARVMTIVQRKASTVPGNRNFHETKFKEQ
jgi:hypothetical protein